MHEDTVQEGHKYPGSRGHYTEKLSFLLPSEHNGIPVYRVLDLDGQVIDPAHDPNIDDAELVSSKACATTDKASQHNGLNGILPIRFL